MMLIFKVPSTTITNKFQEVLKCLTTLLQFPGIPTDSTLFQALADGFKIFLTKPNPLHGLVGAIHTIALRIERPSRGKFPREHYNRKGFHEIAPHVVCDADCLIRCYSARCISATHDSLALTVSNIGQFIRRIHLPKPFGLAGDEASVFRTALQLAYLLSILEEILRKMSLTSFCLLTVSTSRKRLAFSTLDGRLWSLDFGSLRKIVWKLLSLCFSYITTE